MSPMQLVVGTTAGPAAADSYSIPLLNDSSPASSQQQQQQQGARIMARLWLLLLAVLVLLLVAALGAARHLDPSALLDPDPPLSSSNSRSSSSSNLNKHAFSSRSNQVRVVEAENGVVASDDQRCSVVGRNVLGKGGHAVDATVATAACEGVVNPMASGVGGGAFMLLRLSNGTAIAYDMRETAPAAASEDMYRSNPVLKNTGALSVGVPGELAGLHLAWKDHGRLPWKELFQPAIALARNGFVVTPYLEMEMRDNADRILLQKPLRRMLSPNGTLARAGDTLKNKELAAVLEMVAEHGPGVFYNGSVGARMVKDVQQAGGILTVDDLKHYRVKVREPVVVDVMGFTVIGMPPPSSGGAAIALILNIISKFADIFSVSDGLYTHRLVEAFKHTYAVRMNLADPDFVDVSHVLKDMLSPDFAATLKKAILDNTTFPPEYYGGRWDQLEDHGTSHFSIVDFDRNAVAYTTTINWPFGSKLLSASTGILMNNEMNDFAIPGSIHGNPARANFIRPNKRPLSSMSPTIVLKNGELAGVLGASGGSKIITGTAQVFLNYFVRGLDPLAAVSKARVHHQLLPDQVDSEDWTLVTGELVEVAKEIRDALSSRGHKVVEKKGYCVTQVVLQSLGASNRRRRKLTGVSDYRKDGCPAGF